MEAIAENLEVAKKVESTTIRFMPKVVEFKTFEEAEKWVADAPNFGINASVKLPIGAVITINVTNSNLFGKQSRTAYQQVGREAADLLNSSLNILVDVTLPNGDIMKDVKLSLDKVSLEACKKAFINQQPFDGYVGYWGTQSNPLVNEKTKNLNARLMVGTMPNEGLKMPDGYNPDGTKILNDNNLG